MLHDTLEQVLKTTFGFHSFRPGQREAIVTLLEQGRLLCIQPTGHGKSLLYQLPSCILGGVTLVISPLLALMRDQVTHLNERFGIRAAALNTDQTDEENNTIRNEVLKGNLKVLFVAPEQLDHVDRFAFLLNLNITLLVVDEAHCISTWGHDFRPSYRQIIQLLSAVAQRTPSVKILGLTATADKRVEEDIQKQLTLYDQPPAVLRETMNRPNISLSVMPYKGVAMKLTACVSLLSSLEGGGLIYCATRENVELVTEFLQLQGLSVAGYHAGFEPEDKKKLQSAFLADAYKALVATNALGMGIDKANVRFIIHFDTPGSITAYYQEVGRCGRDGLPSVGILLFDPADRQVQQYFIDAALPTLDNFTQVAQAVSSASAPPNLTAIKRLTGLHPTRVNIVIAEMLEQGHLRKESVDGIQVYHCTAVNTKLHLERYEHQQQVKQAELKKMMHYAAQTSECRMALLRTALGEEVVERCGKCDVCTPKSPLEMRSSETALAWLDNRPFPITPSATHKLSAGFSVLDSKLRSPLFVRFMRSRQEASTTEEELLELLFKHFSSLKDVGGILPLPSRSWSARGHLLQALATHFHLPLFDVLYWKEAPPHRQGELLNNDQRHHNVHQKMGVKDPHTLPPGTLILFDDYTGSGNTLREAARSLRATKQIKNPLIPVTLATLKWHLGKPGFS